MSLNVFLAFCILGCDFLIYFLFQWVYGEKHRKHARRVAIRQEKRLTLPDKEVAASRVSRFLGARCITELVRSDRALREEPNLLSTFIALPGVPPPTTRHSFYELWSLFTPNSTAFKEPTPS